MSRLVILQGDTGTGKSEYARTMAHLTGGTVAYTLAEAQHQLLLQKGTVYLDCDYLSHRVQIEVVTMEVRPTGYTHFANGKEFTL